MPWGPSRGGEGGSGRVGGERGPGEGEDIKGGGDIGPCIVLVGMVTLRRMMIMEVVNVMVMIRILLIYAALR